MAGQSKPRFPISQIDMMNKLRGETKKINGLLRRKGSFGTPSTSSPIGLVNNNAPGGGSQSNTSNNPLNNNGVFKVKQISPQTHDHDTSDGVAVGWCPNGVRTQFLIIDIDVFSKSVVVGNVSSVNGVNNYADRAAVNVQLINYKTSTDSGFLIKCETAPVSTDKFNYVIFNPSGESSTAPGTPITTGDGSNCSVWATGKVWARAFGHITGDVNDGNVVLHTDGVIYSIGLQGCAAGGHFRIKVFSSTDPSIPPQGPATLIYESGSTPIQIGWNDVNVSVVIPHAPGQAANIGRVWIGIEVDSNVSLFSEALACLFALHVYGNDGGPSGFQFTGNPYTSYPNVRMSWVEPTP